MSTKSHPELSQLLNQTEFCNHARKSEAWAERARLEGTGPPYIKIGRSVRYRASDVEDWLEANLRRSTSSPSNQRGVEE